MKYIPSIAVVFILSGCLATPDLAKVNDELISPQEQKIASDISNLVPKRCVSGRVSNTTGKFLEESAMKVTDPAAIKRLYSSNQGWYKAEAVTKGIWDNFYYKPSDGSFVCGQRLWDEYADTKNVQFEEVGKKQKRLGISENSADPQRSIASSSSPVEAFRKSITLTYQSNEQLCEDIKWGLLTQAKILELASQGKQYFQIDDDKISSLDKLDEATRVEKTVELFSLLSKQNNMNAILSQCNVSALK